MNKGLIKRLIAFTSAVIIICSIISSIVICDAFTAKSAEAHGAVAWRLFKPFITLLGVLEGSVIDVSHPYQAFAERAYALLCLIFAAAVLMSGMTGIILSLWSRFVITARRVRPSAIALSIGGNSPPAPPLVKGCICQAAMHAWSVCVIMGVRYEHIFREVEG